jgi:hypothetical protein
VALLLGSCDCSSAPAPGQVLGDGYASIGAVDATHVKIDFSRPIDKSTVIASVFSVDNFTVVPPKQATVASVVAKSDTEIVIETSALNEGASYTLGIKGLKDSEHRALDGTLNFIAVGSGPVVDVTVEVDDVETARKYHALIAYATVATDGSFSEQLVAYPLVDNGAKFTAALKVQADPARTLDPGDDGDTAIDRRALALIIKDDTGRPASSLVNFVVPDASANDVSVTIVPPIEIQQPQTDVLPPPPVDANPNDGVKQVLVVVDDRASNELKSPQLKVAFDAQGNFDASFPQTLTLTPMDGDNAGYWAVTVGVKVDPNRTATGSTNDTFPYFAFLVEQGTEYQSLSVAITAPDETPQTVRLSLGNPAWVPVTFLVDVSKSYVTPDGSVRGHYSDESIFLTGEWQQAADALGNNCGDSFTGGENTCLEMRELANKPGVWSRTLWLPGGRPYGYKFVRCAAGVGCGPLNTLVTSSGRAFATVMKNLSTDNADAFSSADIGIVDPLNPAQTQAKGQTLDYTNGTVYKGLQTGAEQDLPGMPDGKTMFKQEIPDLVVVVADIPLKTRVVEIGTWRDVNLPNTPDEIVQQHLQTNLGNSDYDDGMVGRFPPSREAP